MTERRIDDTGIADWNSPWEINRCPRCGSAGTMIFDDPAKHEHWGRCFKCTHFWERQP